MSHHRLHIKKLEEFATYCEQHGWERQQVKGDYEVLRMRHPDWKAPLIVHARHNSSSGTELIHLTTRGNSEAMVSRYVRDKQRTKSAEASETPQPETGSCSS